MSVWGDNEAAHIARILLEEVLSIRYEDIITNKPMTVPPDLERKLAAMIMRLHKREPIQYILGKTSFYGRSFDINPSVLIPRQETEELVNLIVKKHKTLAPEILDIGTGSGCIAITLAKEISQAHVTAIDISEQAIESARQNAYKMGVKVKFIQADVLQLEALPSQYDIVVSNPPYVTEAEKIKMAKHVLNYEPHKALFPGPDDPLIFYRSIADLSFRRIKPEGHIYLEINEKFGGEVTEILQGVGFKNIQVIKDLNWKDRIITGQL